MLEVVEGFLNRPKRPPEVKLWAAVILQALDDLNKPRFKDGAVAWFTANETDECSFLWCAEQVGIQPEQIMRHVSQILEAKAA